jgi:hypothetical protein
MAVSTDETTLKRTVLHHMYAEERQQEILRRTREAGRVDVVTLAEDFGVTMETPFRSSASASSRHSRRATP